MPARAIDCHVLSELSSRFTLASPQPQPDFSQLMALACGSGSSSRPIPPTGIYDPNGKGVILLAALAVGAN